jgi:membrane fusion protein, copper/silver efflux system
MNSVKILKIIAISLAVVLIVLGGYWAYTTYIAKDSKQTSGADIYTCPMHPQIISDRPGQCPICGMDLVKKSELDKEEQDSGHDLGNSEIHGVKLSPSQQVLANVQTEIIKTRTFAGEKTFNGYVKINEKNFAHISTAVAGKITNMYVNFEGQQVSKGQAVMEIYSPELVSTQKEFLLALNNYSQVKKSGNVIAIEQAESLVDASKRRLMQWEMTPGQIAELENSGVVRNTITQYAKYSGIITKKYVHVGHWAYAGEDIYDIADLSNIWVIANIYESDVKLISKGQNVDIYSTSYPDELIRAKVNFVNPVFNQESRTLEVRIDVSNRDLKLKPDMYVKVKINTFAAQTLAVPKNAVIRTGEHNIVYIEKEKGVYEPREVQISYEQDGYYAVVSGLNEGDKVVSSGGFLIDSETQIQAGFQSGHEQHNIKENKDGLKINPDQDIMKDMDNQNKTEHKH